MSRPNKDKVPTQPPTTALFSPFAGLDLRGLPPGVPEETNRSQPPPAKKGRVVIRRETAHRSGKTVIVVDGFDPSFGDSAIETLGKKLRAACGCGGCVKARTIEIQGEQAAKVREILSADGFRVVGEY
jgi:translation initiation factor 1